MILLLLLQYKKSQNNVLALNLTLCKIHDQSLEKTLGKRTLNLVPLQLCCTCYCRKNSAILALIVDKMKLTKVPTAQCNISRYIAPFSGSQNTIHNSHYNLM